MGILGQRDEYIAGKRFRFTIFQYSASGETLEVPSSSNYEALALNATSTTNSKVFHLEGGTAPTATMTINATSNSIAFTVGTLGKILVITMHGESN